MKKYTRIDNIHKIEGTSWQGECIVTYQRLVELFGESDCFDTQKTDAEWIVKNDQGKIFTIYNFKNGKNYLGEKGIPTGQITKWNIGGYNKSGVNEFIVFLESSRENETIISEDTIEKISVKDQFEALKIQEIMKNLYSFEDIRWIVGKIQYGTSNGVKHFCNLLFELLCDANYDNIISEIEK